MGERRRRKGALLRSSYFWKSYISFAILLLISSLVVAIAIERQLSARIEDDMVAEVRQNCRFLATFGPYDGPQQLEQRRLQIADLKQHSQFRFTIIGLGGKAILDSHYPTSEIAPQMRQPEIQAVLSNWTKTGFQSVVRRINPLTRRAEIFVASAVYRDKRLLGFVRVSLPIATIEAKKSELRSVVLWSVGIAVLIGLIFGIYVARWVSSPLITVASLVLAFLEEEEPNKLDGQPRDEISLLTLAFKSLSRILKRRMRKIVRRRKEMTAIFDGMVEGVVAIDTDERVVQINEFAAKLFQLGVQEARNRKIWECTRSPELINVVNEVLATGKKQRIEWRITDGQKDPRTIEVAAAPFEHDRTDSNAKASQDDIAGAVLLFYDVTGLRKLEAMRRDFMANVSHELKTPITAVQGIIETCLDDPDMPVTIRERFLHKAELQIKRLESLVSDLIELSKVETKQRNLKTEIVDLRDVIAEVLMRLNPVAEQKQIEIIEFIENNDLLVCGDAEALEQLIGNLISNALKYSFEKTKIEVTAEQIDNVVQFSVKDEGPGIDSAHHHRIFERFYRVDAARSREAGGTGLGLSIVKHIVRAIDGEVSIESRRGEGARFTVKLPYLTELPDDRRV